MQDDVTLEYITESDFYVKDCEFENIQLREALQQSVMEANILKSKLNNARCIIQQLEIELMKITEDNSDFGSDSGRRKKTVSKEVIERWEFYNNHKNDDNIVDALREQCKSIGIEKVPWQLVKKKTDAMFYHTVLQRDT